jgi:DNA replication licensing factor MCM3
VLILPYRILLKPREHLIALQEVITELALNSDPSNAKALKTNDLQVGLEGSFGTHAVSPRGLMSSLLNKMVVIEGIVTKCSSIRPKLVRSVHFCPVTNSYSIKDYRDATDLDIGIEVKGRERLPTSSAFPTTDSDGNPLELEQGFCQYKDYQTVVLQEMPERARVGQLPRSVELILQHDLVDRIKPGDRAQCVGVYRPLASVQAGQAQGVFRSVVMCNNISVIGKEIGAVRLTGPDVGNIRSDDLPSPMTDVMIIQELN